MPEANNTKVIYSFAGLVDDSLLPFLLEKIESSRDVRKGLKRKICLVTLELINNVIEHHYREPFCRFRLAKKNEEIILRCENNAKAGDVRFVQKRIENIKSKKDKEAFYFSLLNDTRPGVSGMLGLVRIYRNSSGRMRVSGDPASKKLIITLKFGPND
jgi:hypothetical protein